MNSVYQGPSYLDEGVILERNKFCKVAMLTNILSRVCTVMNIALQNITYLQNVFVTDEVTVSWWRDLARDGCLLRFWFLCKFLLSKKITNFLAQFSITI